MEVKKNDMGRTAIVFGASGLIGGHCVQSLLQNPAYDRVGIFVRKATSVSHVKLTEYIINFDSPEGKLPSLTGDDLFWCLGTTIKQAGSRENFRHIEYDYALKFAQLAHREGVNQFLLVSALGAASNSNIFYNQIKGQVEESLKDIKFQALHIFRPSLLLGSRSEFRPAEKLAQVVTPFLNPLLIGSAKKYRPIYGKTVAQAMVTVAAMQKPGVFTYESDEIQKLVQ